MEGDKMKKIILKELSKKMNFRYRILLTIFSDYSIFVFSEGIKIGFNWEL